MFSNLSKYHPDRLIQEFLSSKFADKWSDLISSTILILAWLGLINSILSILASLTWVKEAALWLYENTDRLKPIIIIIANFISNVVDTWHLITEPVYQLLFGWWAFHIPREILDLCIIISILLGGYMRAWLATRVGRRFLRVIRTSSNEYDFSLEGRFAIVKRLIAATHILKSDASKALKDKAEMELVLVLDEMTGGVSEKDFDFLEDALFSYSEKDFEDFLYRCATAEKIIAHSRKIILRRAMIIASILLLFLSIDSLYKSII